MASRVDGRLVQARMHGYPPVVRLKRANHHSHCWSLCFCRVKEFEDIIESANIMQVNIIS